jgi:hypothetical protein
MGADKANIDPLNGELNHNNQTVMIAFNIKDSSFGFRNFPMN